VTETGTLSCEPESQASDDAGAPRSIGRYQVLEKLGAGGMGVVWAARDPDLDRRVAIKVLRPGSGTDASRRGQVRLVREAQAMAKLSHPNVVQVHDAGVEDGRVYVAMEFIEGVTVSRWLDEESRSWREIVRLFIAAGRGLVAAHAVGLVHRDFKPSNVLVAEDGRVRVADFGLAASAGGSAVDDALGGSSMGVLSTELTTRGSIIGTPRYMSPEQRRGEVAGPASDQFSFCVALHEALYGERPFPSATRNSGPLTESDYTAPTSTLGIPRGVVDALRRGLRIDPALRFADLNALLERLERGLGALKRRVQASVFGVLVLGTSVGGWALATSGPGCETSAAAMGEVWTSQRRANVESILARGGASAAVEQLDAYAARWIDAGRDACEANRDGMLEAVAFKRSVSCLEDRKQAMAHLITLVEASDAASGDVAVAATRLPRIGDCSDTALLESGAAAELDAESLAEVEEIRRGVVRASVSHHAGQVESALSALAELEPKAEATEHPPLIAATQLAVGRLAMERQDWTAARAGLERASSVGIAAGVHRVAAEAEARLLFVDARILQDPSELFGRARVVLALAERAGDPAWLRALIHNNLGVAHGMKGEEQAAAEELQRAVDLAAAAPEVDPLDKAGYSLNLAIHTDEVEARDALFESAATVLERSVGRGHYGWLDHMVTWAEFTPDPAQALDRIGDACTQLEQRAHDSPVRAFLCFRRSAWLHEALGERARAREASLSAIEALRDETEGPLFALREVVHTRATLLGGDASAALEVAARADEAFGSQRDAPWVRFELATLAVLRARALAGMDRTEEARTHLDSATDALREAAGISADRGPHLIQARADALRAQLAEP